MKLPTEVSLLVLGFADRQTLGRVLVANRRLSGIVNRHRKTLSLPEIPIPPRLSASLKCLALLAVVTLLLMRIGIMYALCSTLSRLKAARITPESLRDVRRFVGVHNHPVACTTTCDAQLQCRAECDFKYTLQDKGGGTITKRTCSITGLPTTNASPAIDFGLSCTFDYAVNEATVDSAECAFHTVEWHFVMWTTLPLALLALADAVKLLRLERTLADDYMAATWARPRDEALEEHEKLRKVESAGAKPPSLSLDSSDL